MDPRIGHHQCPPLVTRFLYLYSENVNYGRAYKEADEIQRVLKTRIDNPNTPSKDIASCARAWDVLEDRKREIRGKPKAGARKHEVEKKDKRAPWEMGVAMSRDPSDFENEDCSGSEIAAAVPQPDHSESRPAKSPTPTAPWRLWRA